MAAVEEPSLMVTVTGAPPAPPGWIWWLTHQPNPPARTSRDATRPIKILSQGRPPSGAGAWARTGRCRDESSSLVAVEPGLQHHRGGHFVDHPSPGARLHPQLH